MVHPLLSCILSTLPVSGKTSCLYQVPTWEYTLIHLIYFFLALNAFNSTSSDAGLYLPSNNTLAIIGWNFSYIINPVGSSSSISYGYLTSIKKKNNIP